MGQIEIIKGMYSGIICSWFISIRDHQVIFGRKTKSLGRRREGQSEDSKTHTKFEKGSSFSSDQDSDISRTKRDSDLGQQRTVCNFYIILNLYFIRGFTLIQFVPLPMFQCLKKISEDQNGGF